MLKRLISMLPFMNRASTQPTGKFSSTGDSPMSEKNTNSDVKQPVPDPAVVAADSAVVAADPAVVAADPAVVAAPPAVVAAPPAVVAADPAVVVADPAVVAAPPAAVAAPPAAVVVAPPTLEDMVVAGASGIQDLLRQRRESLLTSHDSAGALLAAANQAEQDSQNMTEVDRALVIGIERQEANLASLKTSILGS